MSAESVEGGCQCGAVRFRCTLPSRFCTHCHCNNCRRAHGAAFVTWTGFPRRQFEFLQSDSLATFVTDTGATRSFCAHCGTPLLYESPRWEGEVHVARASLEGEIDREPQGHVYVDHGPGWYTIGDALPQFGGDSGMEPKSG